MREIITTGEDTIFSLINREYGDLDPQALTDKLKFLGQANPQITSLYSLSVGDILVLPDIDDSQAAASTGNEQPPASGDGKKGK